MKVTGHETLTYSLQRLVLAELWVWLEIRIEERKRRGESTVHLEPHLHRVLAALRAGEEAAYGKV